MANNNRFKDDNQVLSRLKKKVFDKGCNILTNEGWDPDIEYDPVWNWLILAAEYKPEITLRRIKLVSINSIPDFDKALKLQAKLKHQLVEIHPYKIFLGNKIALSPNLNKPFYFLSECDRDFYIKFFRNKKLEAKDTENN